MLIYSILGFVLCPVFGIVAWSMGTTAIRTFDEADEYTQQDEVQRGMANAGHVCGIISTLLWLGILILRLLMQNAGTGH